MKALIVDDEGEMRALLRKILEIKEVSCTEAANSQEAETAMASESFDLVTTDLDMGPANAGIDVVHKAREIFGGTTYILVVSGDSDEELQRAILAGANASLRKPFHPADIFRVIESLESSPQKVAA